MEEDERWTGNVIGVCLNERDEWKKEMNEEGKTLEAEY